MDINPAKNRSQVPRQLDIFDWRWSERSLCTNEEQHPPNLSANALKWCRRINQHINRRPFQPMHSYYCVAALYRFASPERQLT
jgi:hypothetical protein